MQNPYLSYASARLACMFYFMAPGLAYGLVTSRMPALKNMTGATEGELGIILLCFGLSALIGLAFAPRLIAKISAKTTLLASSLACMVFVVLVSFSSSVWFFGIAMALLGICMGLCDVTMNVQGVEVERAYKKSSMNILHAGYNIGAAAAACAGSIFAATNFGVWVNFVLPVAVMAGMLWWAEPRLVTGNLEKPERSESSPLVSVEPKKRLPFLVWVCGLLCVCCYVSEGSVGEWGSLYLHQEKAAPESIAALVFAGFSICSLLCRLVADRLRNNFGDFLVSTAGATIALAGMLTVLSSSSWSICLIGYAMMGLGQAPIVPIAFSRAGAIKGVSTARATSLVSLLAYAGLLFAPPAFGLSAEHFGLHTALCAVPVLLTITVLLAFLLGRLIKHSREDTQTVGS
ncbi:MAG TPA: MFS transporter [Candidatus Duodenibacillus intestinavium]|jgi:putative transporter|nr:MFS transporter [Candidatus Duodenibacillus intestinavium]